MSQLKNGGPSQKRLNQRGGEVQRLEDTTQVLLPNSDRCKCSRLRLGLLRRRDERCNSFLQSFESGDDDDPKRRDKFRLIMVARKRWVWSYLNSDQLQISTTLDFKYLSIRQVQPWMLKLFLSFCLSIKYMAHSQLSHPVIHRSIDVTFKSVDPSLSLQSASKLESTSRVCIQTKPNPSHTVLTSYLNRQCHVLYST